MENLEYEPAEKLVSLKMGDIVEVIDSRGAMVGRTSVQRVGKLVVTTTCGRNWTKEYGEWVSEIQDKKPISWPFPSIRKSTDSSQQPAGDGRPGSTGAPHPVGTNR